MRSSSRFPRPRSTGSSRRSSQVLYEPLRSPSPSLVVRLATACLLFAPGCARGVALPCCSEDDSPPPASLLWTRRSECPRRRVYFTGRAQALRAASKRYPRLLSRVERLRGQSGCFSRARPRSALPACPVPCLLLAFTLDPERCGQRAKSTSTAVTAEAILEKWHEYEVAHHVWQHGQREEEAGRSNPLPASHAAEREECRNTE